MKRFYRCHLCGSEFCLKGNTYCDEMKDGGQMLCEGQGGKKHEKVSMAYAGDSIEDLRELRRIQKGK